MEINDPKIPIINANKYWDAPIEMPVQIAKRIKAKLYGSFTAVLNLTTDNAPTKPKDKAKDDLTTAIKDATDIVTNNIVFPKLFLEEYVVEYFLKTNLKNNPKTKDKNNINSPSMNEIPIEKFDMFKLSLL